MSTLSTTQTSASRTRRPKASSLALVGVLALLVLGTGGFYALAASSVSFNNVQVSIETSANLQYSYVVSAYNTTGSLVAYTQTSLPAAAFELPSGGYLFTVTATHQPNYYPCNICETPATGVATKTAAMPIYLNPSAEYGYSLVTVSGPMSLSIKTENTTQIPNTTVTIKASFVNGTAASGAYVSAFVVGQSYYWWGYNTGITMYATTDKSGVATLTVPTAPVQVSAGLSVPINLPKNVTTVTTTVGGQPINVTVYWEPTYAYLTGSALLIPPQNSASITLRYQPQNFYPIAYGASSAPGGIAYTTPPVPASQGAGAGQSASTPSSSTQQTTTQSQSQNGPASQISPFEVSAGPSGSTATGQSTTSASPTTGQSTHPATIVQSGSDSWLLLGGIAVVAAIVAVSALAVYSARKK